MIHVNDSVCILLKTYILSCNLYIKIEFDARTHAYFYSSRINAAHLTCLTLIYTHNWAHTRGQYRAHMAWAVGNFPINPVL